MGERVGGGARHRAGHVGDAIMDDAFGHEERRTVGGGARSLGNAALVDGDIHQYGAGWHLLQ